MSSSYPHYVPVLWQSCVMEVFKTNLFVTPIKSFAVEDAVLGLEELLTTDCQLYDDGKPWSKKKIRSMVMENREKWNTVQIGAFVLLKAGDGADDDGGQKYRLIGLFGFEGCTDPDGVSEINMLISMKVLLEFRDKNHIGTNTMAFLIQRYLPYLHSYFNDPSRHSFNRKVVAFTCYANNKPTLTMYERAVEKLDQYCSNERPSADEGYPSTSVIDFNPTGKSYFKKYVIISFEEGVMRVLIQLLIDIDRKSLALVMRSIDKDRSITPNHQRNVRPKQEVVLGGGGGGEGGGEQLAPPPYLIDAIVECKKNPSECVVPRLKYCMNSNVKKAKKPKEARKKFGKGFTMFAAQLICSEKLFREGRLDLFAEYVKRPGHPVKKILVDSRMMIDSETLATTLAADFVVDIVKNKDEELRRKLDYAYNEGLAMFNSLPPAPPPPPPPHAGIDDSRKILDELFSSESPLDLDENLDWFLIFSQGSPLP
jgi:hypothetical protein